MAQSARQVQGLRDIVNLQGCSYNRPCCVVMTAFVSEAAYELANNRTMILSIVGTQNKDVHGLQFSFYPLSPRRCATEDGLCQHMQPSKAEPHER